MVLRLRYGGSPRDECQQPPPTIAPCDSRASGHLRLRARSRRRESLRSPNVYFPATSAYYRHNYDPFDQATTAAGEVRTGGEWGHPIIERDPPDRSAEAISSMRAAKPVNQVIPAALQAVPQTTTEQLPPPVPSGGTDEPGANWAPTPLADLSTNIVLPGGVLPRDYWNERAPQHIAFFDPLRRDARLAGEHLQLGRQLFLLESALLRGDQSRAVWLRLRLLRPLLQQLRAVGGIGRALLRQRCDLALQDGRRLPVRLRLHAGPLPAGQLPAVALHVLHALQRAGRGVGRRRGDGTDLLDPVGDRSDSHPSHLPLLLYNAAAANFVSTPACRDCPS